uniref:F-box/FBD/LRR-repeat protein At1g13570-like n=1 Tax=Nicotiana tabacum TaxID=4097 RepID=A0A1S3ZDD3_TOBAC
MVPNLVSIPSTSKNPTSAENTTDGVVEQGEQPGEVIEQEEQLDEGRMSPHRSKIKQSDTSQESIDDDDIISDLPGNVIDCILGKMPIRDAIRTSILSKKWRLNYSTIPQLVFDDQFCKELVDFANKKCAPEFSEYELKYHLEEIISKSLMLHPGRIEKFKVCIPNFTTTSVPDVNKWILYLSRKNIKTISLKYMTSIVHHKLPPYFFSCLHLTYLKLLNIHISPPPPEFKGFLNLYKVLLSRVHFGSNCLESFLCSCPVLRALELYWCSGIRHFNISGSKLKKLRIKAYDKFKSISLENAPNLNEVSVMLERVVIGNPNSDLVKFVGSLPKVKTIRVNGMCLKSEVDHLLKQGYLTELFSEKEKQAYMKNRQEPPQPPSPKRTVNVISGGEDIHSITYTASNKVSKVTITYGKRVRQVLENENISFDDADTERVTTPHNDALEKTDLDSRPDTIQEPEENESIKTTIEELEAVMLFDQWPERK